MPREQNAQIHAIGKSLKMSLESCMDVPELMKKLNKKPASQENEAKKEDETAGCGSGRGREPGDIWHQHVSERL